MQAGAPVVLIDRRSRMPIRPSFPAKLAAAPVSDVRAGVAHAAATGGSMGWSALEVPSAPGSGGGGQGGKVGVMRRDRRRLSVSGVPEAQSARLRRRQRWYFALMGTCLALIVLAWNLVRLWSTT